MADTAARRIQVDLSGQVALVTGASRGIGKAIALALGKAGATVACLARNEEKLKETAAEIAAAGGKASTHACDVTNSDAAQAAVDAVVEQHGRLDIVVNNAGITKDTLLPIMSDDDWDQVIAANLRSVFLFSRAAAKVMMRQRSGRIINISSVSGLMGNPGQSNYSASKAGVIGFTRTVAAEVARRGVTVNAVVPGLIETEFTKEVLDGDLAKAIPARRVGSPEEVAACIRFLASEDASYVTGTTLTVDGGLSA
jgi:3-oxoacyl-[acyl-carrier protein] reductase